MSDMAMFQQQLGREGFSFEARLVRPTATQSIGGISRQANQMLTNTHQDECGMWTRPKGPMFHEIMQITFWPSETKAWLAEVRYNTNGDAQVTKMATLVNRAIRNQNRIASDTPFLSHRGISEPLASSDISASIIGVNRRLHSLTENAPRLKAMYILPS
jgi:hypothetical protein